jgi:hypothetical protein
MGLVRARSDGLVHCSSFVMRSIALACVVLALAGTPVGGQDSTASERARVTEALERLMMTGEPRHTFHDDGQWLQGAVDAAIARGDAELARLARRASVPLLARVWSPVSRTGQAPAISFETPTVLKLPTPISYRADLFVSLDGGPVFRLGTLPGLTTTDIRQILPPSANHAGLHHLRVTARITYSATSNLPTETRQLPDLVYGIFDPDKRSPVDPGYVLDAAKGTSVKQLDASLPEEAFELWLQSVTAAHSGRFDRVNDWTIDRCDARTIEPGLIPRSPYICATAWFSVKDGNVGVGQIWIRTARLEAIQGQPVLLAEVPTLEGMTLRGSEFENLAALPELLHTPSDAWPAGDVAVAPEDIEIRRERNVIHVAATIRNNGPLNLHGVLVELATTFDGRVGTEQRFVMKLPKYGSVLVRATLPMSQPYGAVVVHATALSEHGPPDLLQADPTIEDSVAFRIVNPDRAPPRYIESLTSQCGFVCRGY